MKDIDWKKIIIFLSGIIMLAMLVWFGIASEPLDVAFNSEKAYTIDGEFTVQYGETTTTVNVPAQVDIDPDDTLIITKTLTKDDIKGNSIMFYVRQSYVNVYVGDVQCIKDSADRKIPYAITPGSYWHLFRLPDDWEGKELKIEIKADVERYAGEVPAIYTGTKSSFIYMTVSNGAFSLYMCIPILVLGITLVAFGFFTPNKQLRERLIILGLFAMATSIWNLLEARLTQVFFEDIQMATVVLFSCYYIIPFLAACFLDTYETFQRNKIMRGIMYGTGIIYIVLQVLQAFSVIRYIDWVFLGHIMIGVVIGAVIVNYIIQKCHKKVIEDAVVYKAIMLLGIFCFVDIILFYISPMLKAAQFSKIGFLVFFFYLGFSAIAQINEVAIKERESEIYKRLAFTDKMTQINNRTAFEQKVHMMSMGEVVEPTYFYMVDMNNLKKINDNYGHTAGDYAIIEIAKALSQSFGEKECYRIGGDEFCVITEGITVEQIKECGLEVERKLQEASQKLEYDIIIATGFCQVKPDALEESFNNADAMMYRNKALLKQQV